MRPEVTRRLVHAGGTVLPATYLLELLTWAEVRWVLVAGAVVAVAVETARLLFGLWPALLDDLIRGYERDNLAGYALYVVGLSAVGLAFSPRIAVPAMLMLTVADPISGLLGAGELRQLKRAYVMLATFGVCMLVAAPFVPPGVAVLGAVTATLADGAKPVVAGYVIDDNLTIPIGAAVAMAAGLAYLPPVLGGVPAG